jgi:hypothetical protein
MKEVFANICVTGETFFTGKESVYFQAGNALAERAKRIWNVLT